QWYVEAGAERVAYFPNMTEPSLDYPQEAEEKWHSNVLFTGGLHGVPERKELIEHLKERVDLTLYHCLGNPTVTGRDYYAAISNTRIGLNISAFPDFDKCLSDRPYHYLGCGAMLCTREVPEMTRLFTPDKEIITFMSKEEAAEKISYYLEHEPQRAAIAAAGQQAVRARFTPERVVGDMLATIDGTPPDRPWSEVVCP
ncbi:MAG: glycosyltransferase family 1 protein, partial [Magnetococcales bacterium]|nr:glycosyltransferase family 1 protein [Magnetococcales bacterium]